MKITRWILVNGIFAFMLYYAPKINWVGNTLVTFIVAMSVIALLGSGVVQIRNTVRKRYQKREGAPLYIDIPYDVVFVAVLLSYGWFFTAFVYAGTMILNVTIMLGDLEEEPKSKEEKALDDVEKKLAEFKKKHNENKDTP